MEKRGSRRLHQPDNTPAFGEIRNSLHPDMLTATTIGALVEATHPLRRAYHILVADWGTQTADRWSRRYERTLTEDEKSPKRKVTIEEGNGFIEATLSVEGEAVLARSNQQEPLHELVDIPEITVRFPSGRFMLPTELTGIPVDARVRDMGGLEEVFTPTENPNDPVHQQGFANALQRITTALLAA